MKGFSKAWRLTLIGMLAVAALAACGDDKDSSDSAAGTSVSLLAGLNDQQDPTIAVTEFLPGAIKVAVGTTVEWRISGPEPHSVTFLPPGQEPPPPGDESLFPPTPPTGPYDGTQLVNSGLGPLGPDPVPPFRVEFSKAGEFPYGCVIHPNMTGTVTVVASGKADTQQEINARADGELKQWLDEGRAAKEKLEGTGPATSKNPNGSSTWKFDMGATTEHTDILAFAPSSAEIRPGDSVTFVNNSAAPHTATFAGGQQAPQDPTSPEAQSPAPGPSPQTLTSSGLFNTGLLPPNAPPGAGPPEAARSFTFVVPTAGTYNYVCIFHVPSGMAGSIKVA